MISSHRSFISWTTPVNGYGMGLGFWSQNKFYEFHDRHLSGFTLKVLYDSWTRCFCFCDVTARQIFHDIDKKNCDVTARLIKQKQIKHIKTNNLQEAYAFS